MQYITLEMCKNYFYTSAVQQGGPKKIQNCFSFNLKQQQCGKTMSYYIENKYKFFIEIK